MLYAIAEDEAVGLGALGLGTGPGAGLGAEDGAFGMGNGRGVAPVEAHAPDNIASAITNA